MDDRTLERYRKFRSEHPFIPAKSALAFAKSPDYEGLWEERGSGNPLWTREVEGLTIKLHCEDESIYPMPNRHGDTDYGSYVEEQRHWQDYLPDWEGQWAPPVTDAPLGMPYTAIRYSGPGWVQSEGTGYFIPDGIEEEFDCLRRMGQSKQVAWDLTREWVESQLTMLFQSPLTYMDVIVEAWSDDTELATTSMHTDISGDDEGRAYIFEMVEEHGMVDEVVEQAKATIKRLTALRLVD